jgi:uncharacterized protein YkwD
VRFFPNRASAPRLARPCSRAASFTRAATRRAVAAGLVVLVVGTVAPSARATTGAEQAVHGMINETRGASGLRLLRLSERLSRIAHRHSKQMAVRRTLFHSCLTCTIGGDWRKLGENVGFGADYASVEQQFLGSAPHLANIVDPGYRRVGVGVVRRGGLAWVTQIFYA